VLARCPASEPVSSLPVFARTATIPDDLTVGANGDVWVTSTDQGHILDLAADGSLRQDLPDANGPEGIIVTPSRTVVAEQRASRLVRLAADGSVTPFLKLPDRSARLPVDGLGFDAQHRRLLIPNSPEGTLLTTPLNVASPRVLATGLGRPVAATVAKGSIFVAAESKVGLVRVPPHGGAAKRVGTLSNLDEVVAVGGLLYTAGAGDGTIRAVDPTTGVDRVLATGGHQLQGLAALPDGRLLVIDSATRTISFVAPCR
jgi:sugar lactone lactonase YvrE